MSKHTPGAWKVDGRYVFDVEQGMILAEVYNDGELPYKANARLMAAAPEMLEILEAIMGFDSKAYYRAKRRAYELIKELYAASEKRLEDVGTYVAPTPDDL